MSDSAAITRSVAGSFVAARLAARALPAYPGPLPETLADAYARQDAAIALWPDEIAGWKVGGVPDPWPARLGESRLLGPIFRRHLWHARDDVITRLPVIPGGFAAVEAEYVFVLATSVPAERREWTPAQTVEVVAELRVGIELAGSPLATINELGPAVVVSDFGNNAGLLIGGPIANGLSRPLESLTCDMHVDGRRVGRGGAASIAGGPLAALAFALGCCARRGRTLRAGDVISTGACTGVHTVRIGEEVRAAFLGAAELRCRAVRAGPAKPRRTR
ncbi:MAG: 2-keto-4-pentenoate hydratase [Steroidobacteraceae bacterium]